MYKEYDKQRTEDIDPSERRHYPISTIFKYVEISSCEVFDCLESTILTTSSKTSSKNLPSGDSNDSKEQTTAQIEEEKPELNTQQQVEQFLDEVLDDVVIQYKHINRTNAYLFQTCRSVSIEKSRSDNNFW
jgi:hypothetical protein